jgi:hypothetical protein
MADLASYEEYKGKRVVLKRKAADGSLAEVEGTVDTISPIGVLFKAKGSPSLELVVADDIEDISLAPTKEVSIKAKTLKPVQLGGARNHLLERHAYTLAQVNALTEEDAFGVHANIDHVAADLGHVHGEKASSDAPAAE